MKLKIKNPVTLIDSLKKQGKAFKIESTLMTKKIITETNEYYYTANSNLNNSELNLIKSVKKYVNDNKIRSNATKKQVQYINNGILKNAIYKKDLFEIDLKSAYWNFAYKNGFINEKIYKMGNDNKKVSKIARLIALGVLAKRTTTIEFNGVEFETNTIQNTEETEGLFFKVSKQTDAVMNALKFIAGKSYLFYWVDAIFVNSEKAKNDIENYLKSQKLDFKTIPIKKILKTKYKVEVTDENDQIRLFMFENLKIKDLSKVVI